MKIKRYQTIEDLLFELLAFSIPFECRGFLEAKLDGLEVLCEFRDLRSDFLWIFLVKDDFLEKSRNDFHVAFFHAEARDFAGAETDTPRIHVCPTLLGVPGEQVPVHDDSRFFKSFLDVCAEAEALLQTGNVEHHLMRFRVTLVLAQWLETRGSESLGKSFCILDDLPVIFLTEFKHFREGDGKSSNVMQVVVAKHGREASILDPLVKVVGTIRENAAMLRAREGLVRGQREDLSTFLQRLLEIPAADQARYVRPIIGHAGTNFFCHVGEFLHGMEEQEDTPTE